MNFTEYQNLALAKAIYPKKYETIYPALGLCGEAGEVAEKVKKSIRDGLHNWPDEQFKEDLTKELGDVLWYISALASDLDISLNEKRKMKIENGDNEIKEYRDDYFSGKPLYS